MAGKQLHVAQRAAGLVDEPSGPGDERSAARMRRAAFKAEPARYAAANQLTMLTGVIGPPRSDTMIGPVPVVIFRQAERALARAD